MRCTSNDEFMAARDGFGELVSMLGLDCISLASDNEGWGLDVAEIAQSVVGLRLPHRSDLPIKNGPMSRVW